MRISSENTPLPCPHCGKAASRYVEAGFGYSVECPGCRMRGPSAVTTEMALEAWNRLPRLPVFSNEKPASSGFYFMRNPARPDITRVVYLHFGHPDDPHPELLRAGKARTDSDDGPVLRDMKTHYLWAGPLSLPLEIPDGGLNGK